MFDSGCQGRVGTAAAGGCKASKAGHGELRNLRQLSAECLAWALGGCPLSFCDPSLSRTVYYRYQAVLFGTA